MFENFPAVALRASVVYMMGIEYSFVVEQVFFLLVLSIY